MPRVACKQSASSIYHVVDRGEGRQIIFGDDADRAFFIASARRPAGGDVRDAARMVSSGQPLSPFDSSTRILLGRDPEVSGTGGAAIAGTAAATRTWT